MLELKNINKDYGSFSLENISFQVEEGQYFVLLGPSGAGKSVVLEIIAGLVDADSGSICLNDINITNSRIQDRNIGLVFQDQAVFPHLSVYNNIRFPLKAAGVNREEQKRRIRELAEELKIDHLLDRRPGSLSGGELQRVAISRTLAQNPKCILFDEPLSSMDVQLKQGARALLKHLKNRGHTIIHVTHDYEEAIALADRIAVINKGKLIQEGTTREVFQHPKSEFIASFTGVKNFFRAELISDNGSKIAILRNGERVSILTASERGPGYIMIRNEDVFLSDKKQETSAANNFEGIVSDIIPASLGIEVLIDIGVKMSSVITIKSFERLAITEGKKMWVGFKASAVRFIKN